MKYIIKMAFRNIGRNKRRTMLSAVAISIAVMVIALMRGYIGGIIDGMFDSFVKLESGHIKIVNSEYRKREDMMPLEYMVDGFDGGGYREMIPVLESVEGVKNVTPRIKFGVMLSHNERTKTAMGIGVNPAVEDEVTSLSKALVEGQYFEGDENSQNMLIGNGLASKLGIKTGEKITILARTAYDSLRGMTFKVSGVFRYGISAMDDKLFYVPIGAAARLLEMGNGVSEIVLMLNRPEDVDDIMDEVKLRIRQESGNTESADSSKYAVTSWEQQGGFMSFFKVGIYMYWGIYVVLLILASTVIINTTMMVIYERIREIGTIGALGMEAGQIVLLFVVEAMIISAIGSFIGTIVGGAADLFLSIKGINLAALTGGSMDIPATDIIYPRFGLSILVSSFLFGVGVATVIAYFPARRAAKVEPVEALRSV